MSARWRCPALCAACACSCFAPGPDPAADRSVRVSVEWTIEGSQAGSGPFFDAIVGDGSALYAVIDPAGAGPRPLMRFASGGAPVTLVDDIWPAALGTPYAMPLAILGDEIFFARLAEGDACAVWSVDKMRGGAPKQVASAKDPGGNKPCRPLGLVVDGTAFYLAATQMELPSTFDRSWIAQANTSPQTETSTSVFRIDRATGVASLVAPKTDRFRIDLTRALLLADAGSLYWIGYNPYRVMTVPKSGGTPVQLASLGSSGRPSGVAVGSKDVFVATVEYGGASSCTVIAVPKTGGATRTMTHVGGACQDLVVDGSAVYTLLITKNNDDHPIQESLILLGILHIDGDSLKEAGFLPLSTRTLLPTRIELDKDALHVIGASRMVRVPRDLSP